MATIRTKWSGWFRFLAILGGVALAGGGLWFAYSRHWLEPVFTQLRHLTGRDKVAAQDADDMEDMPGMPGMKVRKHKGAADLKSDVPGYSTVMIAPDVQQRIGVKVGDRLKEVPLRMSVRTVGIVRPDETKVARIHLRTDGWAEKLFVNFTGQEIDKDKPLLSIYSPQFLSTQEDYLNARKGDRPGMAESARQRLELWGVPPKVLEDLDKTGKPVKNLTLLSPLTGTVLELNVREKEYVTPAKELYVLADLSTVWVQAKVYEYELPHVKLGERATVTFSALPKREFKGKVVFVQPTVEEKTRTVQVRIELDNEKDGILKKDWLLKPGMFGDVEIQHKMGDGLLVPTSAVLRSGERDIVFRAEKENRFVPVIVKIAEWKFGDQFQILDGLTAGDRVVTSANFLIDSESRLRYGGDSKPSMPGMDMGNRPGMDHKKDAKDHDHSKP